MTYSVRSGFEALQSFAVCTCSELTGPPDTPLRVTMSGISSLSITTHGMFFAYRKHIQVCNKLHVIKLKMTNRSQLPNKQNYELQATSHPSHTYLQAHLRKEVLCAIYKTLNRKMPFTSHTACVCLAISSSAFTSHLINDCFQCPPTYSTLSVDKNIFPRPIFCLSVGLNMHKHADCLHFHF